MHEGLPAPFLPPSPLREPPQVTLFLHHHDLPFAILEHSLTTTVHKSFVSACAESAYKTNHDLCHSYALCFLSEIAPGLIIFYYLQLIIFYYVSLFGGEWQKHAWLICILLLVTLWSVALQASLPLRFSRQEYWSG